MTIHPNNILVLSACSFGIAAGGIGLSIAKVTLVQALQGFTLVGVGLVATIAAMTIGFLVEKKQMPAKVGLIATAAVSALALLATLVVFACIFVKPSLVIVGLLFSLGAGFNNCLVAYGRWEKECYMIGNRPVSALIHEAEAINIQSDEKLHEVEQMSASLRKDQEDTLSIGSEYLRNLQ